VFNACSPPTFLASGSRALPVAAYGRIMTASLATVKRNRGGKMKTKKMTKQQITEQLEKLPG
jgi:hypothetical protein